MNTELEKVAAEHGDRLRVIPVKRLKELREVIESFRERKDAVNAVYVWKIVQREPSAKTGS